MMQFQLKHSRDGLAFVVSDIGLEMGLDAVEYDLFGEESFDAVQVDGEVDACRAIRASARDGATVVGFI